MTKECRRSEIKTAKRKAATIDDRNVNKGNSFFNHKKNVDVEMSDVSKNLASNIQHLNICFDFTLIPPI